MKRFMALAIMAFMVFAISLNVYALKVVVLPGQKQFSAAGGQLCNPIDYVVTLDNGILVRNAEINVSVSSGGGSVLWYSRLTNEYGAASVIVSLGPNEGRNIFTVTAKHDGETASMALVLKGIIPVVDKYLVASGVTSRVWEKYIGEITDGTVPDIADYSYAGYGGDGSELIPKVHNLPIHDVTSYGAIPNDGLSDTRAIRDAFRAVEGGNAVVYFPAGHYDIFMDNDGDSRREIRIGYVGRPLSNLIVKGDGGQGSKLGGTTIQMHNDLISPVYPWGYALFKTVWVGGDGGVSSRVVGSFSRGTKYFDVEDASPFSNKRYIKIQAGNLTGSDWDDHSSRPKTDMRSGWKLSEPDNNIAIQEKHEIDRVVGNRIYVKKATLTPLNSNYVIYSLNMHSGIGFEDLHLDCGFTNPNYQHVVDEENGGINLNQAANSWIKHCRITNTTVAVSAHNCYAVSIIGVIVDGGYSGHYDATVIDSTFTLVAFVEDWSTSGRKVHGISVATGSTGTVAWRIGGDTMRGPDCHGGSPRYTLFDNYFSTNHDTNSGTGVYSPHHLDGYVRWNNKADENSTPNYWIRWSALTNPIFVGYVSGGGAPLNTYSESHGTRVNIDSLYVSQLTHRLGYTPQWIFDAQHEYREFFNKVFSRSEDASPTFYGRQPATRYIQENSPAGTNIGKPVIAYSLNPITYRLAGENGDHFAIDASTGQITVQNHIDYEIKKSYTVIVIANNGQDSSISVKINVHNVVGDFVSVSQRTPQVRDAIRGALKRNGYRLNLYPVITADMVLNLKSLAIFNKTFDGLKVGDLDGLDNLEDLSIEDNQITNPTFYEGIFDELLKLEDLWLFGNGLTALNAGIFKNNIHLRNLDLSDNALTELSPKLFSTLTKLDALEFDNNNLMAIPDNLLKGLTKLTHLRMNGNEIETFQSGAFKDLVELNNLYIENNNITKLPQGIFKGLGKLKRLDLRGNPGSPFNVSVNLVSNPDKLLQYRASCYYHAPFELKLKITVQNGHAVVQGGGARTSYLTINAGESFSNIIEVVPDVNPQGDVTIDVTLPNIPNNHNGYVLQKVNNYSLVQSIGGAAAIPMPTETAIFKNFPNPFNPETWIPYQLSEDSDVSVTIYNSRGVVIRDLKLGIISAGFYVDKSRAAYWDGRNKAGERVSSGMYFYLFKAGDRSVLKKMVILK